MTRQYSLWKLEPVSKQIIQKLGEPIAKGGADLSLDQVSSLDSKTLYTIASDLASFKDELVAIQNMKNLDTTLCTKVVKWVNQFLLQDKIQVKKFTFPTPSSFSPDNIEEMAAEDELDKKYLQSKNLHKSEKAFLDDLLNNYTLKDLTKPSPIATDKMSFKMKHREETIKLVVSVAKEHLNFKKGGNKQGLNFFIAKGGSGSGKSRILTEIPNIMRKATELDAIFQNTQIIYFNFVVNQQKDGW
ncbi:hypothetical protein C9374_010817 [Naegleria lovaniensis]|uniref:Uncharacterized protein n=1 Tax=Naegleria lovaniensis TaxID=51637 RepID=A0AA88GGN3_NAELO|nr:uncharacterized protein C9374_010817 [Naegleria lovaniensis]KAG2374533.1 hypothetical protein C9374_010817 [Naegleria lovaniensis]